MQLKILTQCHKIAALKPHLLAKISSSLRTALFACRISSNLQMSIEYLFNVYCQAQFHSSISTQTRQAHVQHQHAWPYSRWLTPS